MNINDFASADNDLLFIEGYSFRIDSLPWKAIKERAELVLQAVDTFKNDHYKDGSNYALYFRSQSRHGNPNHETLFEGFNTFLKDSLLQQFIQKRKPKIHRTSTSTR